MATFENWGDYFWPGQIDECRRNLLGIRDPALLEREERIHTSTRAVELASTQASVVETFDLDHLRAIHRHVFQDVYEWAGELRVTELVRPSADPDAPGHEFIRPDDIGRLAPTIFDQLGDPVGLTDLPRSDQIDRLAATYAGVNVLHPFIEGNGRTQRIFLQHVARAAGLVIDWSKMPDQNAVMAEAFTVGYRPVADALEPCIAKSPPED